MSASLVGSEMCIRDRCDGGQHSSSCKAVSLEHPVANVEAWLRRRVSVSYTHLTLPTICSV
eukprot:9658621-Alexandrium_andersonii.AAC.1